MSHPFGDLLSQYLHRKHGLSQAKLAEGILQDPSIIGKMCKGQRLNGPQARERVCAIIDWLRTQGVLSNANEANQLLIAAAMAPLRANNAIEQALLKQFRPQTTASLLTAPVTPRRTNLPTPLTSFIGRTKDVAEVSQRVVTKRLVTLIGVGGVGKTRLAIEVAKTLLDFRFGIKDVAESGNRKSESANRKFPDGVWLVELAALTAPNDDAPLGTVLVAQAIARAIKRPEQTGSITLDAVQEYLADKQLLLVLDNCEHLAAACAEISERLLHHCWGLHILTTSREDLRIAGETLYPVLPLALPSATEHTPERVLASAAAQLLVDRMRAVQPTLQMEDNEISTLAHICRQLDGIPLALELAAPLTRSLSLAEIATQLDDQMALLTNGYRTSIPRHQTMHSALVWSYRLLSAEQQRLLTQLSVFAGGWTLAAAQAVGMDGGAANVTLVYVATLLNQLVNKSLVLADQQASQTRYRLLETVRQFAAKQLATDKQAYRQAQAQQSHYYLRLLAEQERRLQSPQQRAALEMLSVDFENIKIAWQRALERHDFSLLVQATHTLFLYCEVCGHFREGVLLFAAAADKLTAASEASTTNRADIQPLLGQVLTRLGACELLDASDESSAKNHLEQALQYIRTDWEHAFTLAYLGHAAIVRGEWPVGQAKLQQSLALSRRCQDPGLTAQALYFLNRMTSKYAEAIRDYEESLTLWRQVGRPDRIVDVLNFLAWHTCCLGDYAKAIAYWEENISICINLGKEDSLAWASNCRGMAAWCQGDLVTAQSYIQQAADRYRAIGMRSSVGMCLAELALVARSGGEIEQAVALARQAVAIARDTDDRMQIVVSLNYLGAALISANAAEAAREALTEALQRAFVAQWGQFIAIAFYYFAELLVLESYGADAPLALEGKSLAVALLSWVRTEAATWQVFKDKALQLQAEIEGALPTEFCMTVRARGQNYALAELVGKVLNAVTTA